ncbi:hypothetical protein FA95DRAFT_1470093, partial [Auriscalpium vulgare]
RFIDTLEQAWKDKTVIAMSPIDADDFDAFLSILYPSKLDEPELSSLGEWTSVLKLATRWDCASIRRLTIKHLNAVTTPYDRLILGRTYSVEEWIQPAMIALCERKESMTREEGHRMRYEDIITIAAARD